MMQISNKFHIWHILDSLPPSYLPVNYIEKAVIDFKGTLNCPMAMTRPHDTMTGMTPMSSSVDTAVAQ